MQRSPFAASTLRHVRRERAAFDGRFFERRGEFWPIALAASAFADREEWPEVADYVRAFGDSPPPVRFEPAPARRRRPGDGPVPREELYDAVIVRRRVVPTRPRMWHDYLNALVWASFPRAKLALHQRQHAAIQRWIPEGATRLPNARTRELDALALLDEGGVLVLEQGAQTMTLIFGHALFEGLVLEQRAMIARSLVLDARVAGAGDPVRLADDLLAGILADPGRVTSPDELARVAL